jgi:hypothetical protein
MKTLTTFFFFNDLIIKFIFLRMGHKYSIVDNKKKLLELCKICTINITLINEISSKSDCTSLKLYLRSLSL